MTEYTTFCHKCGKECYPSEMFTHTENGETFHVCEECEHPWTKCPNLKVGDKVKVVKYAGEDQIDKIFTIKKLVDTKGGGILAELDNDDNFTNIENLEKVDKIPTLEEQFVDKIMNYLR